MQGLRRHGKVAIALAALLAAALTACSSGSSGSTGGATGNPDAVDAALKAGGTITYWTWTPQGQAQVDAFQKEYPNVHVNLVNPGKADEAYKRLQNVIKAGSGAPDVAQIEYQALPQFALTGALVDLGQYGFSSFENDYTASTWNSVHSGGALYGLPQDSGPMALFYNKEIFDKYGIAVPKTWDEYLAAAKKLHAADPTKYITADNGDAGFATSMIWQAGGQPFSSDGKNVKINLADAGTKKWTATWNQLVQDQLVTKITSWSDEWFKALGNGTIATLPSGAWMPANFESSVPDGKGKWAVAPMPTYDGGQEVTAENGGSTQSVLKQSANPALAAGFVRWLNHGNGVKTFVAQGGFPATNAELQDPSFTGKAWDYFGGQQVNQVLTAAAGQVVKGWTYLPYQLYANSIFNDTVGKVYTGGVDLDTGLADWQKSLVDYGTQQGFSVNAG